MVFGRKGVLVNLVVPGRSPDTIHPKRGAPKKEAKAKVSMERAIAARGVTRERERERDALNGATKGRGTGSLPALVTLQSPRCVHSKKPAGY